MRKTYAGDENKEYSPSTVLRVDLILKGRPDYEKQKQNEPCSKMKRQ
jgi:hypothetical protein